MCRLSNCGDLSKLTFLSFFPLVGGRADPFTSGRRAALALRHSLLPRHWLPAHDDPALPGQRAGAAARARAVPGVDDDRRGRAAGGGRVLGLARRTKGEWRGLSLSLRYGRCGRGGQGGQLHDRVGAGRRRLGVAVDAVPRPDQWGLEVMLAEQYTTNLSLHLEPRFYWPKSGCANLSTWSRATSLLWATQCTCSDSRHGAILG